VCLVNSFLKVDQHVKLLDTARKSDISLGTAHNIFDNKPKNTQICEGIFLNNTHKRSCGAHSRASDMPVQSTIKDSSFCCALL